MPLQPLAIDNFNLGGLADSKFSGVKHSLAKIIGCDLHSTAGLLKVRQKLTKISGSTVDAFCLVGFPCSDGKHYYFSATTGKIWSVSNDLATVTLVYTTVPDKGGAGCLGAWEYSGYIYWATEKRLHRIAISGTADATAWTANAELDWQELNLDQDAIGGTGQTYTLKNALSETATDLQTYVPLNSPLEAVGVNVNGVGTGNWTITVHDSANNVIATKSIANGSMATGWVIFEFSALTYPVVGGTYHIHVFSSTNDGTVKTLTASDLETGNIKIYSTSDAEFHPMLDQNLVLFIGDRHNLHQVDASGGVHTFSRQALDIAPPLRIKSLGRFNTDILLGTIISNGVAKSRIVRWDAAGSVSFSSSDDIPEVGINAFLDADNYTIVNAGVAGNFYSYDGFQLKRLKKIQGDYSKTAQAQVNPYSVGSLQGLILFGMSNITGNPCDLGVYMMGNYDPKYPLITDLSFPVSERFGTAPDDLVLSNIEIGAISVNTFDALIAWRRKATITISITDPGVVTYTGHNFATGNPIVFTTTGALPTGLTAGTIYFARVIDANTLNIYDTSAHAVSGGATGRVATTGSQSGIHTAESYGIDKIDYSNKLNGALIESRVLVYEREFEQTAGLIFAAYELMPAGCDIKIGYKKNYAANYVALATKPDTDHNLILVEDDSPAFNTIQLQFKFIVNGNNAPTMESGALFPQ